MNDNIKPGSSGEPSQDLGYDEDEDDQMSEEELALMREARAEYDAHKAKHKCDDCGKPCESWLCQECCEHDEHEHGYCIECGANIMDDIVGRAEMARDAAEDR